MQKKGRRGLQFSSISIIYFQDDDRIQVNVLSLFHAIPLNGLHPDFLELIVKRFDSVNLSTCFPMDSSIMLMPNIRNHRIPSITMRKSRSISILNDRPLMKSMHHVLKNRTRYSIDLIRFRVQPCYYPMKSLRICHRVHRN